jgi:hypothetical protein
MYVGLLFKPIMNSKKAVILLEANHDWTVLRLQDFKSIGEYNHIVHKICARLRFYEKEPSEANKIEKTLQTMLLSDRILQHQYRAKNYQTYSYLISDLLQAEKHDKLTLRNHYQRSVGSTPLSEVHYNVKGSEKGNGPKNPQKKFSKFKKGKRNGRNMKNMAKSQGKGKGKAFTCHKMWWSKPLCQKMLNP